MAWEKISGYPVQIEKQTNYKSSGKAPVSVEMGKGEIHQRLHAQTVLTMITCRPMPGQAGHMEPHSQPPQQHAGDWGARSAVANASSPT